MWDGLYSLIFQNKKKKLNYDNKEIEKLENNTKKIFDSNREINLFKFINF
jgi:hypothetical protein